MKIAFTFPGQGSQSIGMLADLASIYPLVKTTFAEASAVLGYDLWQLTQNGPEEKLNRTQHTQPAILSADVAILRIWEQQGGLAAVMAAGHSLGEYAALVAADSLPFSAAVSLVRDRGRLMQAAVAEGEGAIAAILGLEDEQVKSLCNEASAEQHVSAVNFNAPGQVAIAGDAEAVERAMELAKSRGAKRAIRLPLSVPVHCELMRPAAEAFSKLLAEVDFSPPRIPVIHNVDVATHLDSGSIRRILTEQVYQPVRWTETIRQLKGEGIDTLIELGPGKVLSGLTRRVDRDLTALAVTDTASLNTALAHTGPES